MSDVKSDNGQWKCACLRGYLPYCCQPNTGNSKRDNMVLKILHYLNQEEKLATYKAVAELVGLSERKPSRFLGNSRPCASWVVTKGKRKPSGYCDYQKHPKLRELEGKGLKELKDNDKIILPKNEMEENKKDSLEKRLKKCKQK